MRGELIIIGRFSMIHTCVHILYRLLTTKASLDIIRNWELLKTGMGLPKSSSVFLEGTIVCPQKTRCLRANALLLIEEKQDRDVMEL